MTLLHSHRVQLNQAATKRDLPVWTGLAALLLALGLLSMSFSFWRNDLRNFPNANGEYPTSSGNHGRQVLFENHVRPIALCGMTLLAVSMLLLSRLGDSSRPLETDYRERAGA